MARRKRPLAVDVRDTVTNYIRERNESGSSVTMTTIPGTTAVRNHSTRYGLLTLVAGVLLLFALRLWASPLGRRITGRSENGLVEFLSIPVFFLVVGGGIALFLWEPDAE